MYIQDIEILHKRFPEKDHYPFNLPVLRGSDRLRLKRRVALLEGENGSGKSTLLEAIARGYGLTVWGGEKSHVVHHNPFSKSLHHFLVMSGSWDRGSILTGFFFRAESFFNFAAFVDDMTLTDEGILQFYGGRSLHEQSHGEAFIAFFDSRCRRPGLYILDEPEAALSPDNQLLFLRMLYQITQQEKTQFIISTHSPIILGCPGAQIVSCDRIPIQDISYRETKSYRFYEAFMEDPDTFLSGVRKHA